MKSKIWKNTVRILLILLAFVGAGAFMALRTLTFVNPWAVAAVSLALAFPLGWLIARKGQVIVPIMNLPLRMAVWIILIAPVLAGAFYTVNYFGADEARPTKVTAVVESKYSETRQRTRRIRKGRYAATGESYQVHYADIRLADGHLVTVPLTGERILKVRRGQHLDVDVIPGALGIPVVISKTIFHSFR